MTTSVPPQIRTTPEVGAHPNVPAAEYHRWEGASNSRLSVLRRSPAHLKAYLDGASKDTPALRIGSACHTAILEPDTFTTRYVRNIEGDGRTKAVKDARAELELRVGPDRVLAPSEYDLALAIRDSVHAHPGSSALLRVASHRELSIAWDEGGVRCKARLDGYAPGVAGGTIIDIKTTGDASLAEFERSIFNMGYHRQAALYLRGMKALGMDAEHFVIIAVEKEAPYAVAAYRITEGAIDAGWEQLQPLIARYAECVTSNNWPAYSPDVQDIALPAWAWAKIDAEAGGGA